MRIVRDTGDADQNAVNQILSATDPIVALAVAAHEDLMNNPVFLAVCNQIVFKDMGLHPKSMVGGDDSDEEEFWENWFHDRGMELPVKPKVWNRLKREGEIPDYISESDPRYMLYWETLSNVMSHVFAQMIRSSRVWPVIGGN